MVFTGEDLVADPSDQAKTLGVEAPASVVSRLPRIA